MISLVRYVVGAVAACAVAGQVAGAEMALAPGVLSMKKEASAAVGRGLRFLASTQNTNGWWSTPEHPSVTALALFAGAGDPDRRWADLPGRRKGYQFLLGCVQTNGGIYVRDLANYNTAISVMALLAAEEPEFREPVAAARSFIIRSQVRPGAAGGAYAGGIGYSDKDGTIHSDMNNTLVALEALHYSRDSIARDTGKPAEDLDWKAAAAFLERCQNLPGVNRQPWVSVDPADVGGFVYDPESSKAGTVTNANGKVALRSYGSISYAGLLSYIYADLKADDPRVRAVADWLGKHASYEENPGMGQQGYYYYLHLMVKALTAAGMDELTDAKGNRVAWRPEVLRRLLELQKGDGSWLNASGRWWESDPNLVTSYALITLETLLRRD